MNANITSHFLRDYLETTDPIHIPKEAIIVYPDKEPDGLYMIKSGYVKAYSITESGEQHSRVTYKEGEYFPLLWAFKDIHRDIYYQAQSEVVLHRISREDLEDMMDKHPEVVREMLSMAMNIYVLVANRLENMEIDSAYKRIVFRLITLSDRFGRPNGDDIFIPVQFSHQDFAYSLNMARETASRQLQKLKQSGLISYQSKYITVHNLAKLKAELE